MTRDYTSLRVVPTERLIELLNMDPLSPFASRIADIQPNVFHLVLMDAPNVNTSIGDDYSVSRVQVQVHTVNNARPQYFTMEIPHHHYESLRKV